MPLWRFSIFHFQNTLKGLTQCFWTKNTCFCGWKKLNGTRDQPLSLNGKCHEIIPLFFSPSLNMSNMIIHQIWNIPNCSNTHNQIPNPIIQCSKQINTSNISPITKISKTNIHKLQYPTKHQSVHNTNTPNSKSHQAPICSATRSVSHPETVGCLRVKL